MKKYFCDGCGMEAPSLIALTVVGFSGGEKQTKIMDVCRRCHAVIARGSTFVVELGRPLRETARIFKEGSA